MKDQSHLAEHLRIVVKLGTSTLTDGTSGLSLSRMVDLVRQMSRLNGEGHEVLLVSSGAIATGREVLKFPQLPKEIPAKQMLAAVGQPRLMDQYGHLFGIYGLTVAQVLLTREDLRSRRGYLNARNTLLALLGQGVVPIINENDTVATEEIRVGDNDNLSALVSNLIDADLLILLTDQEGLMTTDPRTDPDAEIISLVDTPEIDPVLWEMAGGGSAIGVGGMVTKLQAADLARRSGASVVIAKGDTRDVIIRVVKGENLGTRFLPVETAVESRKRFILTGGGNGKLVIDQGAGEALLRGSSLLPAGLLQVVGDFGRGETVTVSVEDGKGIGRGLVNYKVEDCRKLCGCQSNEIESRLGYFYGEEIIHRDNLVLL
ncbi:MAG: glutamate 5-kinase [Chloroflexi bacterium RBG_16_48_8]|nr:MAG: glutamate 5-kinase [Chloroflexi bacterium RBG_16_48_8]